MSNHGVGFYLVAGILLAALVALIQVLRGRFAAHRAMNGLYSACGGAGLFYAVATFRDGLDGFLTLVALPALILLSLILFAVDVVRTVNGPPSRPRPLTILRVFCLLALAGAVVRHIDLSVPAAPSARPAEPPRTAPGPLPPPRTQPEPPSSAPDVRAPQADPFRAWTDAAQFSAGQPITHHWSPVRGAQSYELDFSVGGGASEAWDTPRTFAGTEATLTHDDAHPILRWRVRAMDGEGQVLGTAVASYTVVRR